MDWRLPCTIRGSPPVTRADGPEGPKSWEKRKRGRKCLRIVRVVTERMVLRMMYTCDIEGVPPGDCNEPLITMTCNWCVRNGTISWMWV
jgi:hypothetical protein